MKQYVDEKIHTYLKSNKYISAQGGYLQNKHFPLTNTLS